MKYILLLPASLLVTLVAYLLGPLLPLVWESSLRDSFWPFWWPDNDIDGDRGWRTDLPVGSYWRRVLWCWKNPAYNFDVEVCGARIYGNDPVWIWGNPDIKARDFGIRGWYFCTVSGYWNFKCVVPLGSRCWMCEFGWKLQDYAKGSTPTVRPQIVFSPLRLPTFIPADRL